MFGLKQELAARRPVTRLAGWWLMLVCWPVACLTYAVEAGLKDRRKTGASFWGKFHSYYAAALKHNALPHDLQWLGMRAGVAPEMASQLLFNRDTRIWQALNQLNGFNGEDVQDKARFFQICQAANLPVVPVYAAFDGGEGLLPVNRNAAAGRSLFVKSLRGNLGEGAAIWHWGEGGYRNGDAAHPTLDDLLAELSHEDCVIQPLLRDHAALRGAGSEGLSTVRIVTVRTPDGRVQTACALLLMAKGMLSQYGEYFGVDVLDGSLTTWLDQGADTPLRRSQLPEGFALQAIPDWSNLLAMTCDAHAKAFANFSALGWDVVLTDEGAFLLEANQGWGIMLHQVLGEPMGHTAIGAAASVWLDHSARQ
jgi:hypothetical protein